MLIQSVGGRQIARLLQQGGGHFRRAVLLCAAGFAQLVVRCRVDVEENTGN